MYDKRRDMKYIVGNAAVGRELDAIKDGEKELNLETEHRVIHNFNKKVFKSLKKILVKITKAS